MTPLRDFRAVGDFPVEALRKYAKDTPEELQNFWETTGLGFFSEDFMRVIDPRGVSRALQLIYETIGQLGFMYHHVPIFASAFGDVVTYDGKGTYYGINFNRAVISEVGVRLPYLLQDLQSGFFHREMFSPDGYKQALMEYGTPNLDECFVWDSEHVKGTLPLAKFMLMRGNGHFELE